MLMVVFYAGNDRFAIDSSLVAEIVPAVPLRPIPQAPAFVAGLFHYRGVVVPVVDLRCMIQGTPCKEVLSSRIMLVQYRGQMLGLLAERVTEVIQKPAVGVAPSPLALNAAPYLGDVLTTNEEMTQCLEVETLLTDEARKILFPEISPPPQQTGVSASDVPG